VLRAGDIQEREKREPVNLLDKWAHPVGPVEVVFAPVGTCKNLEEDVNQSVMAPLTQVPVETSPLA